MKLTRNARLYIALMILAGTAAAVSAMSDCRRPSYQGLFFFACALIASTLKVTLPGVSSTLSINYVFILLSASTFDVGQTIFTAIACTITQSFWRRRTRPRLVQVAFNLSSATVASWICYHTYNLPWLMAINGSLPIRMCMASVGYYLVNTFSVAGILALSENKPVLTVWRENYLWTAPQYLFGATVSGMMKLIGNMMGWQWSLLIMPTMYLAYRSYRLYLGRVEQERRHVREVADLHLRTIEALAIAIEAKDETTHDHLRRVQVYATELGMELKVSDAENQALRAAALLHDIGKLAVPEYILSKPGRLSPEEFEKIKIHPIVGAEILDRVKFPYPVVPIVAAHHEKWDGTGYPNGLRGEDIPLGARILSVVDCLDALTSTRQYRTAMPLDEAMNEIEKQAGSSFDPKVVTALRRTYRDLEVKARTAPALDMRLSKPSKVTAGLAPAAGLEITAEMPKAQSASFTHLIASARQEFQDIHELTRDLGSSLNLDGTMSVLASRLKSIVPHDGIVIYVSKQDVLVPRYFDGIPAADFSSFEIPYGRGLSGWVAENRKPIVNGNPLVEQGREETTSFQDLHSAISIPLIGSRDMVGVLTLYHKQRYAFNSDHLRLLMAISSKAALTLENALEYQEAKESATIDALTGLPNTRSLFVHLDAELSRCRRIDGTLSVLVLDLDGFKSVNDRFGHLTGNRVLTAVANGLRKACRDYDYVARMGGDEFVVVLPEMSPEAVQAKCDALGQIVVEAGKACVGEEILGLSAGAAHFPSDGENMEALLAEADRRMYQIKRHHKTRGPVIAPLVRRAAAAA